MLYCGCEETNFFAPGTSSPASICSTVHSLKPISRDLAGFADLGERLHRLLDRRLGIGAVALVEVDVVGLKPLERGVELLVDLLAREAAVGLLIGKKTLVAST